MVSFFQFQKARMPPPWLSISREGLHENPPVIGEESCDNADADTIFIMESNSWPESPTFPKTYNGIGKSYQQNLSSYLSQRECTRECSLLNAEQISWLWQHVPSPTILAASFSQGCNQKSNVSWLSKYPWLRYSPTLVAKSVGHILCSVKKISKGHKFACEQAIV